ncbi:hypothetical protein C0995_012631 [Termitomyces sp. Mi166|nr:hypothetical protein C0995_012631 [Termitomyces sp. Mi166\
MRPERASLYRKGGMDRLRSLLEATQGTSQVLQQHDAAIVAELNCKAPKAQVRAAHTAAADSDAESNAEEDQEELINDKEVPPEVKEPEDEDDAESIHIDGDEYVTVDIYDNEYYMCEDDEEHLFALTEYQGDRRIRMQHVTLQKAADKLQRP